MDDCEGRGQLLASGQLGLALRRKGVSGSRGRAGSSGSSGRTGLALRRKGVSGSGVCTGTVGSVDVVAGLALRRKGVSGSAGAGASERVMDIGSKLSSGMDVGGGGGARDGGGRCAADCCAWELPQSVDGGLEMDSAGLVPRLLVASGHVGLLWTL